jgi:Dyp-type peroxidase family
MSRRSPSLQLEDIQGNLLKGYGLPHAAHLFVRVRDAAAGQGFLRDLAGEVTTARAWSNRDHAATTLNVAVSARGLRAIGLPEDVMETFPSEFRQGMAARADRLGDDGLSRPQTWEKGLRQGEVELVVSLHAQSPDALSARVDGLRKRAKSTHHLDVGCPQLAATLPDEPHYGREHFGYSDGFAQPAIAGGPVEMRPGDGVPGRWGGWRPLKAGEFVLGYPDEDGGVPPAPAAPYGRNGTFMVLRKLRQDVIGFRAMLRAAADALWSRDEELVAAKIAGRWRDGTPIILAPTSRELERAAHSRHTNAFRYRSDPGGRVCPIGAHIRRANPRDGLYGGGQRVRRHRIIRRGMPYGPPLPLGAKDRIERGLLFVCFNASIVRQFEVVNGWCMDGNAFGLGDDRDFMLGENGAHDGKMTLQGDPPTFLAPSRPLVVTRGGEYLFQPGITALHALGRLGGGRARRRPARGSDSFRVG